MNFKRLMLSVGLVVLGIGIQAFAGQTSSSPAFTFPIHDELGNEVQPATEVSGGFAELIAEPFAVSMVFEGVGLEPGDAVTAWWVVFNHPEFCSDGVCGGNDVLPPPGNTDAGVSVLYADGKVINAQGQAKFASILMPNDLNGAVFGPGLTNPMGAEIHLVLRTHGPMILEKRSEQLSSLNGGCDPEPPNTPCKDVQFAIFTPANLNETPETLAQAMDSDDNGTLEDSEVLAAMSLWINGQTVESTGKTISDNEILDLINIWIQGDRV